MPQHWWPSTTATIDSPATAGAGGPNLAAPPTQWGSCRTASELATGRHPKISRTQFHVPILLKHRKYLCFDVGEGIGQYCHHSFGYLLAPGTCSECGERTSSPLRESEARILTYIDNWLILISSQREARAHTELVTKHITQLGFAVSFGKSTLRLSQQVQYLGLHLDARAMNARLSEECMAARLHLAHRLKRAVTVMAGRFTWLLAMSLAAHPGVRLALLHMRSFQRWFACLELHPSCDKLCRLLCVPAQARSNINFWTSPSCLLGWKLRN